MKALEKNITTIYGQKGRQFLQELPHLIAQIEIEYGLSDLKPVKNLSYNYVLSGFQGALPIILKLGLDNDGLKREAIALSAFAGLGAAKVLAEKDGMLLLERAISGISLRNYFPGKEQEAIDITGGCLKKLHQAPLPSSKMFPHIKDWLIALNKDLNIPIHYLHKARQLRDELLESGTKAVLLHGDLHHDNILQQGDDWIVIDPKGVIGEPAYEVAAFIRNPIPELLVLNNVVNLISHRITRFSEILEIPERRILDWCYVQAVLAWTWALEDGSDESYFRQLTEIFDKKITISTTDKLEINVALVHKLVVTQFPQWAALSINPVEFSGWDNRSFHLGEHMLIRLPSAACYSSQIEKEQRWLPKLAPFLPLPIPLSVAMGMPTEAYPWHWSINRWLEGQTASIERIKDLRQFAISLAEFLVALQQCDTTDGPLAGAHSFYRGGDLATYNVETREAIAALDDKVVAKAVTVVWDDALASTWQCPRVWIHGDIAVGNLLVQNGALSAVIDFGQLAIGDPACDLAIAWTLFTGQSRQAFRDVLKLDKGTWARGRGWALWKALCWAFPGEKRIDWRLVNEVLADYKEEKR